MCSCEEDWKWTATTLSRTCDQAQQVLKRSLLRKFSYPPAKAMSSNEIKAKSSLDDAFTSVMNSMSICTKECLQYYQQLDPRFRNNADEKFCARYLPPSHD